MCSVNKTTDDLDKTAGQIKRWKYSHDHRFNTVLEVWETKAGHSFEPYRKLSSVQRVTVTVRGICVVTVTHF